MSVALKAQSDGPSSRPTPYLRIFGGRHWGTNASGSYVRTDPTGAQHLVRPRQGSAYTLSVGGGYLPFRWFGSEITATWQRGLATQVDEGSGGVSAIHRTEQLQVVSSLIAVVPIGEGQVYIKAGAVLPLYSFTQRRVYGLWVGEVEYRIANRWVPGLNGSVGFGYPVSRRWWVFVEAEETNLQARHRKGKLVSNTEGVPPIIDYVDSSTVGVGASWAEPFSLSRLGVNLGCRFQFGAPR